jgi:hypothetical protein
LVGFGRPAAPATASVEKFGNCGKREYPLPANFQGPDRIFISCSSIGNVLPTGTECQGELFTIERRPLRELLLQDCESGTSRRRRWDADRILL